jgi:replicative DNA helicase Mcm
MDNSEIFGKFLEFLKKTEWHTRLVETAVKGSKSFVIPFEEIDKWDPALSDELLERPQEVIAEMESSLVGEQLPTAEKIFVRISNLPQSRTYRLADLRTQHLGKLIQVEGLIRQASEVRPEVMEVSYECIRCGNLINLLQSEQSLRKPTMCACGGERFKEGDKTFHDIQNIKLQELPDSTISGEQASQIDVILQDDLVEPSLKSRLTPGNRVRLTGILEHKPMKTRRGEGKGRVFDIYIKCAFIEPIQQEFETIVITPEDEENIKKLAADPHVRKKIINSIAPSIYGHENVKEGIAIQLFGGVTKIKKDGSRSRGDVHIFLIGDPGAGKSQLLKYASQMAPKAMYVSGKGATGAGLTAVVVKDEFLGGWALEAGAVVLCNKGLCCIDEMDKMNPDDRVAIHEVMEQGSVSIAKATIHANLKSETTILAAANPKNSRFNAFKEIREQIDLPDTILSRFDLIYPIRDVPKKDIDTALADHMLDMASEPSLAEGPLNNVMLRKYIAYARHNFSPKINQAAKEEIRKFYVGLRHKYAEKTGTENGGGDQAIPITPRQLEAIVRITEANAKIRLSNIATAEDALNAIRLMVSCMNEVGLDPETGQLDANRLTGDITASRRNKTTIFEETFKVLEASMPGGVIPRITLIKEVMLRGLTEAQVEEILSYKMRDGTLFAPRITEVARIK